MIDGRGRCRHELGDAVVEMRAVLGRSTITLSDLLELQAGDVLTTDFAGGLTVFAEGVPMFRGNSASRAVNRPSRSQCHHSVPRSAQATSRGIHEQSIKISRSG